jgi:hypothetical protein
MILETEGIEGGHNPTRMFRNEKTGIKVCEITEVSQP